MLLSHLFVLALVAVASAKNRKRACKPAQKPVNPTWTNGTKVAPQHNGGIGQIGQLNVGGNRHSTTLETLPAATSAAADGGFGGGAAVGGTLQASFTSYGSGDAMGSGTCETTSNACGGLLGGYTAALSQNYFGVGGGAGAGPGCGKCYALTMTADSSGNPAHGSITVRINNLCPAEGNILCAQQGHSGKNSVGKNIHFDLCMNDGTAAHFFPGGSGMGTGTAVPVDC